MNKQDSPIWLAIKRFFKTGVASREVCLVSTAINAMVDFGHITFSIFHE